MPLKVNCACIAAFLACLFPIALFAADGDLTQYQLSNGLRIYVYEKHTVPIASVQVWYQAGCLQERPGIRGLSHLLEHMMLKGSERFGPKEQSQRISEMGGWSNAGTSLDYTYYVQVVPRSGVDLVMEMEADRMARLKLEKEPFETEREVVKEEYRMGVENNLMGRIEHKIFRQYFGSHPYSWGPIGEMEDLETLTFEDCREYYQLHYAPNNAALIVVGDVSPEEVREMAERHFGPIAASERVETGAPPPLWTGPMTLSARDDIPIPLSGVVLRGPPAGHEDIPALEVLIEMLGWHLDYELTRKQKTCVYVLPIALTMKQSSFVAFVGVHFPNISAERVNKTIEAEIADYLASGLTQDELDRTRNTMLLGETLQRYSSNVVAERIGYALFVEGNLDRFWKRRDRLATLTPQDIAAVGERYFVKENRAYIVIEPEHPSRLIHVAGWFKSLFHL